jgi:hypothetical protein
MKRFRKDPLEDLLVGRSGVAERDELAELLASAKQSLLRDPDESTAVIHLTAIARAVAEENTRQTTPVTVPLATWRKVMARTTSFALKLGAAATALFAGTVGLAYAGVDLPGTAAERAVERTLGVELPNQATEDHGKPDNEGENGDKSVSDEVRAVKESTDERGCEFGQAVAEAARANSQNEDAGRDKPCKEKETDATHGKSDEEHGKADEEHGKADEDHGKADEPHGKSDEIHGKSDEEHGKADEAPANGERGKSDEEHGNAGDPQGSRETGEESSAENNSEKNPKPKGSRERGTEASEQGQSHRPDDEE